MDKVRVVTGESEVAEALTGVKIFKHVQEELVEQSVFPLRQRRGLGSIIFGLDAVLRAVLLEVEQAVCIIQRG